MRILYVEDNPANVFLVKRVAKMGQHEIINFIDGGEAIRKFDEVDPDLILMDIQLAGETSGLEVVKTLRGRGVQTPIIAVTAYAMVGDKERCIAAGCNDYLAKPLPIPRLIQMFEIYDVKAKEIRATQSQPAVAETPTTADEPVANEDISPTSELPETVTTQALPSDPKELSVSSVETDAAKAVTEPTKPEAMTKEVLHPEPAKKIEQDSSSEVDTSPSKTIDVVTENENQENDNIVSDKTEVQ